MTLSILVPAELAQAVAKRLRKLGQSCGVEITEVGGLTRLIRGKETLACRRITVGALPHTGGWVFVAKLEHLEGGNVVSRGPGEYETELDAWRTLPALCSHCNTKRRRSETFLLRSPAGDLRQIARNCLADFVCGDASRLIRSADLAAEIGNEMSEERWGSYRWEVSPVAFIACAVASVEQSGFRKSTEEGSTKAAAEFATGPKPKTEQNGKLWEEMQPTDAHVATAEAAIAWLADHEASGSSEYIWNLRLCLAEPDVGKHAGLLASVPVAYFRHLGRETLGKVEAKQGGPSSGYAAAVGEVFQGEATLVRVVNIPPSDNSRFATSKTICTFRTAGGHEVVWFATGRAPTLDHSPRYLIKGRVKKHETYRGVDQTVLQRVSFKPMERA